MPQIRMSELRQGLASGKITDDDVTKLKAAGYTVLDDETSAAPAAPTMADQAREHIKNIRETGGLPPATPDTQQTTLTPVAGAIDSFLNAPTMNPVGQAVLRGAYKGAQETGTNLLKFAKGAIHGDFGPYDDPSFQREYEAVQQTHGPSEATGKFGERALEFLGGEAAARGVIGGGSLLANVLRGAAVGGGVTAVQGGDAKTGAIVGAAIPVAGKVVEPLADKLAQSAVQSYSRVLGATKQTMKNVTAKVVSGYDVAGTHVPGLLDRGIMAWTRKGLSEKAAAEAANFGDQIDNLWSQLPAGDAIPAQPIQDALTTAQKRFQETVGGVTTDIEPAQVQNLKRIGKIIDGLTDSNGNIDSAMARRVKGVWDRIVAQKGGYQGVSLADNARLQSRMEAANAIREELAKAHPDIAEVNRQYHFWTQVGDVMDETLTRTSSQSQPMGKQLARVAGAAAGAPGAVKAILTGEAAGAFRDLTTSAAWGTMSAVAKNRLANLLASGQTNAALLGMKAAMQAGVSTSTKRHGAGGSW